MKNFKYFTLFILILALFIPSCQNKAPLNSNKAVIAISSDISSYVPLYAVNFNDGMVMQLLYPGLVRHEWNYSTGEAERKPMLADKWEWSSDSSSITFYLNKKAEWNDGQPVTAKDVEFTFDVSSDPLVQSRFYGSFRSLAVDSSQHIILDKTFKIINPHEFTVYFKKGDVPNFVDLEIPIIPEHMFAGIDRKDFNTALKDIKPISDGPFDLEKWDKNQALYFKANHKFLFYNKNSIQELILKIVPDYNSEITQLKSGEVDFVQDVKADDIPELVKKGNLQVDPIKGRDYDYIGWNNIDPEIYKKTGKFVPNKLFGDTRVREAMAYATNREEVVKEFMDNYGQPAVSPIAPIFTSALDTTLKPIPYDPQKAKELLAEAGWKEVNGEGVLSKGKQKFTFTLNIPSGNPRREFAATLFKNNLRAVGIDMNISASEPGVFFPKMYAREYNAWMAGWTVAIPIMIKPLWYSTMPDGAYNLVSYQNKKVDKIIDNIETTNSPKEKNMLYKKFQEILYRDQPTTFLYWVDNIVVYNKRIQNVVISPLGPIDNCWEWRVNP